MADRVPDMIRVPKTYKATGGQSVQALALKAEFGPALGNPKEIWFNSQTGPFILIHAARHEYLNFTRDHPWDGRSRYDWRPVEGKPGVEYGYKVEGADSTPDAAMAIDQKAAEAEATKAAEMVAKAGAKNA